MTRIVGQTITHAPAVTYEIVVHLVDGTKFAYSSRNYPNFMPSMAFTPSLADTDGEIVIIPPQAIVKITARSRTDS